MEGERKQPIGKGVTRPQGQRDVIRDLSVRLEGAYRSQEEAGRMIARAEEGRAELRNTCAMLAVGVYESGAKAMGLHDALVAIEAFTKGRGRRRHWVGGVGLLAAIAALVWGHVPLVGAVIAVVATVALWEAWRPVPAHLSEAVTRALEGKAGEAIRAQLESSERRLELAEWATSKAIEELVQADTAAGDEGTPLPSCVIVWNGAEASPWAVKIPKWDVVIRGANPREVLATAVAVLGDLRRNDEAKGGSEASN